jgi:hypothetical protein
MTIRSRRLPSILAGLVAMALAGCATRVDPDPPPNVRPESVVAVDHAGTLLRFNAGDPARITHRVRVQGLPAGETLVGIDYRVARGLLFALSSGGRLYTLDVGSGRLAPVGSASAVPLQGRRFGVDFNPTVDRLRVVSDTGQNLRLHPDTGALVSNDPPLVQAGAPRPLLAAGYTYNKDDEKLTTNYAIDASRGWLVRQGSMEGVQPVVSPNTGQVFDVGPLGTGPLEDVSFDIADIGNTALIAAPVRGRTRLMMVDLASGRATPLGTIDRGQPLLGLAIEP